MGANVGAHVGLSHRQGRQVSDPLAFPGAVRTAFDKEGIAPAGVFAPAITVTTLVAVVCPLLALIFLPLPGNPMVSAVGLQGDIIAAGASCSPCRWRASSLAGSRLHPIRASQPTGTPGCWLAQLSAALALTAIAQTFVSLRLDTITTPASVPMIILITRALAAAAFACALPVLARATTLQQVEYDTPLPSSELGEISGRHLALFRVGEALQLVAVAAVFVSVFIMPLVSGVTNTGLRYLIWALAIIAVAVGVALWDALRRQAIERAERPPVTWWLGIPVRLALAQLVAAAWAGRGV